MSHTSEGTDAESTTLKASMSGASICSSKSSPSSGSIEDNVRPVAAIAAQHAPPADDTVDVLSQSLAVTDHIFGIYAIELWVYDESTGKLANVGLGSRDEEIGKRGAGLLLKRRTQEADPNNDYSTPEARVAFNKLTDASRKDFLPANTTDPGVGLPGVLWAEQSSSVTRATAMIHNLPRNTRLATFGQSSQRHHNSERSLGGSRRGFHHHPNDDGGILWRNVVELANDPDQPYDERLQAFAKAGFELAAGVPFDSKGYRGIVIYFGNPHADPQKLRHPANSNFMNNAAQMIGCAAALRGPMNQIKAFRHEVNNQNWHRVKVKTLAVLRFGGSLLVRSGAEEQESVTNEMPSKRAKSFIARIHEASSSYRQDAKATLNEAKESAKNRVSRWQKKIQGGGAGIPPSFSWRQCMWSFIGVMITHTILSRINLLIQTESDGDLSLILAPLGALTTLQYNLTAAPASQPRNAIFAQIFALTTAILLSYIPNVEPWFRSALAPAIVIPGMAKLGIIHPPAGAAAIVFSSGKFRWEHFGIFLSGVAISIITAVGINNMSDKRQYPTSWYFLNKAKGKLSE